MYGSVRGAPSNGRPYRDRREFMTLLGSAAAAWPLAARAQQGEPVRRIGVLVAGLSDKDAEGQLRMAAFRRGLQNLGWIEGRNVELIDRWAGGSPERLRASAAELVALRPDVIFAGNDAAALALQKMTSTLAIVFAQVIDPVATGLVASLARPGGNITGFAELELGIAAKWGELLGELAPRPARVGVIYDPANSAQRLVPALATALPNMQLLPFSVRSRSEVEEAIERIGSEPNGALIILPGPLAVAHRELIIILAVKHRLPLIYPYAYYTFAGGLMSYGPDPVDRDRLAATYVDRVLKGEKPAELPVQLPTKYIPTLNLKTAKALGLEVPPTLLARADEVIE
jgi:putative tryptophan/tyrosine transport system substrate-binding protein